VQITSIKKEHNLFDNNSQRWNYLFNAYKKLLLRHVSKEYEKKGKQKKLNIDPETKKQLKALGYL
jgi:hypothetical protein